MACDSDFSADSTSCFFRTVRWASGFTFLSLFSHLHLTRPLPQHGHNRQLQGCREDNWCLLYSRHLLIPQGLRGSTGCGPLFCAKNSHTEPLISWRFWSFFALSPLHPSNASSASHPGGNKTVVLEDFLTFPVRALLAAEADVSRG